MVFQHLLLLEEVVFIVVMFVILCLIGTADVAGIHEYRVELCIAKNFICKASKIPRSDSIPTSNDIVNIIHRPMQAPETARVSSLAEAKAKALARNRLEA